MRSHTHARTHVHIHTYTRRIVLSPPLACKRSVFTDAAMRFFRPRQTGFAIAALGFRCDPFAAVFRCAVHNRVAL